MRALYALIVLGTAASPAFANVLPEPGSLALVGVAIAAGIAVAIRRKK